MRKSLIKKEKYVEYFQQLAVSPEVQSFQNKALLYAFTIEQYQGEEIPEFINKIKELEKEVEKGRSPVNDTLNEMKKLNQGIYQIIKDKLKALRESAKDNYDIWIREETRKRNQLQAKLEREAEAKRLEQQKEIDKAKNNNVLPPPEVIIPTPRVKDLVIAKSIARKDVKAIVEDKIAFIKDAIKRNDPELLDCIEITKTTGIVNKAKRNPGEFEVDGVEIIFYPNDEAWGIVSEYHPTRDGIPNYKRIDRGGQP